MSELKQFTRKALAIVAVALAFSAMAGSRPQAPVGTIHDFLGKEPPAGFLPCDGKAVSRTTYAALFAVIGTRFGSGDGKTTFNLPNFGGKFAEGTTSDSSVGASRAPGVPDVTGDVTASICTFCGTGNIPTGSGAFLSSSKTSSNKGYVDGGGATYFMMRFSAADGELHGDNYRNDVYGKSETVQPKSIVVMKIIKY